MKRLLVVCWFLAQVLPASGAHGPTASHCVSCGLRPKTEVNQFGFTETPLGHHLAAWYPADIDGDGAWEIVARTESMTHELGVFDPQTASWILGPCATPIATTDPWHPVDVLGKGYLQIVYYSGGTIRVFDPVVYTDDALWTVPYAPVEQVIFWGRAETEFPVVFIVSSRKRHTHELLSGDSIATIKGTANSQHRAYGYPLDGSTALITESRYRSSFLVPGFSWLSDRCGFEVFDDHGKYVTGFEYWVYEGRLEPNVYGPSLRYIQLLPEPGSQTIITLRYQTDHLFNQNGWWLQRLEPNSGGYEDITHWLAPWSSVVPFDLYDDGLKCWLVPLGEGGWERRTLSDGNIIDTVPGPGDVPLRVGPILEPLSEGLFYISGASLFIFRPDIPTGVFDDPETNQLTSNVVTVSAHPNPFNSTVTLTWSGTASSLTIFNVLGQAVTKMALDGKTSATWDGCDSRSHECPSGIYIGQVASRDFTASTKIVLLR